MTLSTRVRLLEPRAVRPVFDYCHQLVGGKAVRAEPSWDKVNRTLMVEPDSGNDAWLIVKYGADGPIIDNAEWDEEEDGPRDPEAFIEIDFDTGYSFRDEQGRSCTDLHRGYVETLAKELIPRTPFAWQNEFTGEWTVWGSPENEANLAAFK